MKIKKVWNETYKFYLVFVIGKNADVRKYLMKKYNHDIGERRFEGKACSFEKKDTAIEYVLSVPSKNHISAASHEANHIVSYVFADREIELTAKNDEPASYLIEFVMREFLKIK